MLRSLLDENGLGDTSKPLSNEDDAPFEGTISEEVCDICNGNGTVPGDAPWIECEPLTCDSCRGSGIRRDYLREAFLIVQDRSHLIPEPKHLKAVIAYCRRLVSAAVSLPEVK